MIVVDANVVVYRYIDGPFTKAAQALLVQDADWRVPLLWRYEFVNALITMMRNELLGEQDARRAWTEADNEMTPRESPIAQERVLALATQYRISGYDAQYIALAQFLSLPCITAGKSLARKTKGITVLLGDFTNSREMQE